MLATALNHARAPGNAPKLWLTVAKNFCDKNRKPSPIFYILLQIQKQEGKETALQLQHENAKMDVNFFPSRLKQTKGR